jgi:putative nucleotidyltransferase with HDIG domain
MNEAILLVDDEANIRMSLRRLLADTDVTVLESGCGDDAADVLRSREIAVIVTDNRMPGMSGVDLLACAKVMRPDASRILMTGYADLPTAIDAINQGEVFRFILKPWENAAFLQAVTDGLVRHRTVRSLRSGDEATLRSIGQTIELKDPYTRGHCDRVASYALAIGSALGMQGGGEVLRDIRHGSWLHDCGKIGVPEAILNHPGSLGEREMAVIRNHPQWGAEVARQAGLPRAVIEIVLCHHERWDGKGYPAGVAGERIPLEARIVAVADTFDAMTSDRPYRKALAPGIAREAIANAAGTQLDPRFVSRFLEALDSRTIPFPAGEGVHA